MDLDDGIDATTPGLTDHTGRHMVPFLRTQQSFEKQQLQLQLQLQQQQQQQQSPHGQQMTQVQQQQQQLGQNGLRSTNSLQLRHNNAMAVSIETDVWLLGKWSKKNVAYILGPSWPFVEKYS